MEIPLALTFDDVLLVPQASDIESRSLVSLKTRISKNIELNIPLVSSNMDTVTEDRMCIAIAQHGGIGILHRYCTIEQQAEMVKRVKRTESHIITQPYTIQYNATLANLKNKISQTQVHSYLVVQNENAVELELLGILTNRDIKMFEADYEAERLLLDKSLREPTVQNFMTRDPNLVYGEPNIEMRTAQKMMMENRIQKLPLVENVGGTRYIRGLICLKDIERIESRPLASIDSRGRLLCGAAVGVKDGLDRANALVDAGVDLLVVDIAHGHSTMCLSMITKLKNKFPSVDVIGGNVCTREGAEALIKAGADGIKVGIGNGGICSTRLVSGSGKPQLSALLEIASLCQQYNVPMISDGGNKNSGNICKALAAGASCVMLGRILAGSDEAPSPVVIEDGKRMKIHRGMASWAANHSNSLRQNLPVPDSITSHVEGVSGLVPYSGPVKDTLVQICNGIQSGLSYSGCRTILELQEKRKFIRCTQNGVSESGIHDVRRL